MTKRHQADEHEGDKPRFAAVHESPAGSPADPEQMPEAAGRTSAEAQASEEVTRLMAEKEELTKTLIRRQADFENYRKRIERERREDTRRAAGWLVQELLPVLDGLDRALRQRETPASDEYRKGVELIYRQFWDILSKHGLERIAAAGKQFDPHYHEAIERVETRDQPDGSIIEVVQEGYLFDGRVLRPSLVRVAVDAEGNSGDRSSSPGGTNA
jgi:molecular chaperone GrpE